MEIKRSLAIILCILVILISGCTNTETNDDGEFRGVEEGVLADLLTTALDGDYDLDFTFEELGGIDEKLALDIGNTVIKSVWSCADKDVLKNTKFSVSELKDRDVFIICRYYEDRLGGDYNVAISKKDGAILKMWIDE